MFNKFKISRRGRKLQTSDDPRTLLAMPKDVPERTWADILQREDNELVCLDLREEILDNALQIGYDFYMEKQMSPFLVFCTAEAWLKLIDWHFYRHDPGEDPSALPLCFIPRRVESWQPDTLPQPSPKDTWGTQQLEVLEQCQTDFAPEDRESTSNVMMILPEINSKFWFPGRVNLTTVYETRDGVTKVHNIEKDGPRPDVELMIRGNQWKFIQVDSDADEESEKLGTESEVLQKVVDYGEEQTLGESSQDQLGSPHPPSLVEGSLRGAGDSVEPSVDKLNPRVKSMDAWSSGRHGGSRIRSGFSRLQYAGRNLPPMPGIVTPSILSRISDCRLRNHRLETNFEISTEKFDTMDSRTQKLKDLARRRADRLARKSMDKASPESAKPAMLDRQKSITQPIDDSETSTEDTKTALFYLQSKETLFKYFRIEEDIKPPSEHNFYERARIIRPLLKAKHRSWN